MVSRNSAACYRYTLRKSRRHVSDSSIGPSALFLIKSGRFRWVYCLLDILRRCFPASINGVLEQLPETLDETYEHILLRIDKVKRQFAHRLFQCLAISIRPLRVEELAEILAVRFDIRTLPKMSSGLAGFIQVSGLSVTREPETRKLGFLEVSVRNLIFPPILATLFCSHEWVLVPQSRLTFPPNSPEVS